MKLCKGAHFIGGKWIITEKNFENQPVQSKPDKFSVGTCELVDEAAMEAERAFENYSNKTDSKRAAFLREIAI